MRFNRRIVSIEKAVGQRAKNTPTRAPEKSVA